MVAITLLTSTLNSVITEKLWLGRSPEWSVVSFIVLQMRSTTAFAKEKSTFSQPNSLITGNVVKENKTLGLTYNQLVGTSTDERSEPANRWTEKGHWEMDTIRSDRGATTALLTIVDRTTCLLATTKLDNLSQSTVYCFKVFLRLPWPILNSDCLPKQRAFLRSSTDKALPITPMNVAQTNGSIANFITVFRKGYSSVRFYKQHFRMWLTVLITKPENASIG